MANSKVVFSERMAAIMAQGKGIGRGNGSQKAVISSDLPYMKWLEEGTTMMPARPIMKPYEVEYKAITCINILEQMIAQPANLKEGIRKALNDSAIVIAKLFEERTAQPAGPYYTGRAATSWVIRLAGGGTITNISPVTASMQRAILNARARRGTAAIKRASAKKAVIAATAPSASNRAQRFAEAAANHKAATEAAAAQAFRARVIYGEAATARRAAEDAARNKKGN